jgi:hypothetical protein
MYELNRIRLYQVGPRGARYTDVTLDLSGVGAMVPTQGGLFDAPTRRPSPSSLLLLENGGGKSVLLKLLFSVFLPGKRNTVGGSAAVMEKFVVGDDAAHVVLEWMHVRTGDRIVTGKTLQRRSTRAAGDQLAEHWWSLRPTAAAEIGTLPFTANDRRLRLDGFREALAEIDRAAPGMQLTWVGPEVGAWSQHLRNLGIEPDLFAIQRRMNADEGDAANAFKFTSSKDFVEWLLKVVLDPDDALSVAGNFDSYATTVGDRQAMLLEKDFVAGAVETLQPAAAAWERHRAARTAQQQAHKRGSRLLAALRARVAAVAVATDELRSASNAAASDVVSRETDRDRARDVANEVRRQTLALELDSALVEQEYAAGQRDAAAAELRGWALADLLARHAAAEERAGQLGERISEAEQTARPALEARDAAAGRLLRKLRAESDTARTERDERNRDADTHTAAARQHDAERTTHVAAAAHARAEQDAAAKTVAGAKSQVDAAVSRGLLDPNPDVPHAAAVAADDAEAACQRAATAEQDLTDAEALVRSTAAEARGAHDKLGRSRSARDSAEAAVQDIVDRAAPLMSSDVVKANLSIDSVDIDTLDAAADTLVAQLQTDESRRGERLAELRAAQLADQRLLDALGDGGLLPPRIDVEETLSVLHSAGIAAHSGWRYLAENVASVERAAIIAAHPDLVDGVVVVDPAALRSARTAVTEARLLPAAAVAVGSGSRLFSTVADDETDRFVVEPNPALFDTAAAEERRVVVREKMTSRRAEIDEVDGQVTELRELRTELTLWRRLCPPGRLENERDALDAAETELHAAAVEDAAAREAAAAADVVRTRCNDEVKQRRAEERAASDRAGELGRLADVVAAADTQRRRVSELEEVADRAQRRADELAGDRDAQQALATEAARTAENASDRAERHLAAMRDVATSTGVQPEHIPDEALSDLRATYTAAAQTYAAVEVGRDLRAEADTAEAEVARLRADVAGHPAADVTRGRELLRSADGADTAGRQAAADRADRERMRSEAAISAAMEKLGKLRSELRAATPSDNRNVWIVLPADRRPATVDEGRNLLEAAAAEQRAAQEELEAAVALAADLKRQAGAAVEAARAFREVLAPLEALLEETPADDDAEPFTGDAAQAHAETDEVKTALRDTGREERDSRAARDKLVDAAIRFASDPRFEATSNVARRALVGLDREELAARAGEFAASLEQRLSTLTSDLETTARHRKLIVERLAALADGALKTLRTASRLSKLPARLGDWEGKEFLRIRFAEPDPSLLIARIGEVVDDMAAAMSTRTPGARGSAPKRDGLALLLRSIDAAVPRGFTVDLLKPDAVLRDERVPVEDMNEVFSGGQELTAAIILYCTMAALRANERGQMRTRHSGVLFLDNPIGKASAEYLLELQQGVAAALGVQLVYTTGLSDDRALAAFPLWVRMRNDADLRAGMKHIRVADIVRRQLPDPYSDDEANGDAAAPGTVTATRVYRRLA